MFSGERGGEEIPPKETELTSPETGELDGTWLIGHFSGKTRADVVRMLESRADAGIGDDLYYMSLKGLAYYLPAVLDYLRSPASEGDSELIFCCTNALATRCLRDNHLTEKICRDIQAIASCMRANLKKFHCETTDYSWQLDVMANASGEHL